MITITPVTITNGIPTLRFHKNSVYTLSYYTCAYIYIYIYIYVCVCVCVCVCVYSHIYYIITYISTAPHLHYTPSPTGSNYILRERLAGSSVSVGVDTFEENLCPSDIRTLIAGANGRGVRKDGEGVIVV